MWWESEQMWQKSKMNVTNESKLMWQKRVKWMWLKKRMKVMKNWMNAIQ